MSMTAKHVELCNIARQPRGRPDIRRLQAEELCDTAEPRLQQLDRHHLVSSCRPEAKLQEVARAQLATEAGSELSVIAL